MCVCARARVCVCVCVCLSVCLSPDVGSIVFYFVLCESTFIRELREQEFQVNVCSFGCYRLKEHCCPLGAPFFVIRVYVSSMSFPLSVLCVHFPSCGLCRCLLLSKLCTHLFPLSELSIRLRLAAGWSPVVISLSHHLLVASVGVCCQSGLCTQLSLLSELDVCLCLAVGLSFCHLFFVNSFSCTDVCSRWSII